MSVRCMTRVWDLDLPDSDKIVLLALADCANDEGHCWPSVASLVRKCSKSERTIQASIKRLVDEGLLARREVPGKGCNYTVLPRSGCAPAEPAPPQGTTGTPAAAADKPSVTVITEAKAPVDRVIDCWNEEGDRSGLHKVRVLDNSRKQQLRLRIKSHGVETMLEAVRKAHASPFLRGEIGDGRKADINIILQPKTLARVLEGFYGEDGAKAVPASIEEQIATLRERIPFFESINRQDEADECRRKIAALERPADPQMAANVVQLARGVGQRAEKILRGVAAQ